VRALQDAFVELKWIEDFVMLANVGSFSRAAGARHVTQSAFSRRIQQLEAWLGTTLINRASLPAELTEEGRAFLPVAQETIRTLYLLRQTLSPQEEARDCRVTFAALHTLTMTLLPEWLEVARKTLPELVSTIIPDRGGIEANLEALTSGEADLLLTYAHPFVPRLLNPKDFKGRILGVERLLPVAAPSLHLAAEAPLSGEGLLEQAIRLGISLPYLDYGKNSFFGVALQRVFGQAPTLRRRTIHQGTISDGLRRCALVGWGVCWLPEALIGDDLRAGRLRLASDNPGWILPVQICVYRHRARNRPLVEQLWDTLPSMAEGPGS